MSLVALVSILGPDRVGLVSDISASLFSAGVNLRDTHFAAMGEGAEFSAICELPHGIALAEVQRGLAALPSLAGAEIRVLPYPFDHRTRPVERITHRVEVAGGDQPGLIARLAEIFAQYGANIVRLDARNLPDGAGGRYVTRFAIWLPPEQRALCLATVDSTARTLGLSCRVEEEPA
jgi:glycine cleavage system transcriptional repressor